MSLRGSTVETRRRIVILSAYRTSILPLTDEDMVVVAERGEPTLYFTINEMIERFEQMRSVQSYGIIRVEIRNVESNELERIVRTRWDDLREARERVRIENVQRQIERLQSSL